jgi:hypothetical protein
MSAKKKNWLNPNVTEFQPDSKQYTTWLNPNVTEFRPTSSSQEEELEDGVEGAFFPDYRMCTCCHGIVYSCSGQMCASLDGCVCLYDPNFYTGANFSIIQTSPKNTQAPSGGKSKYAAAISQKTHIPQEVDSQSQKDIWIPDRKKCSCCKGYVYNCTKEICESITDTCACMQL